MIDRSSLCGCDLKVRHPTTTERIETGCTAVPTASPCLPVAKTGIELKILYASSPCGSGKTHQIIARACEMANRDLVVIVVQPTIELIEKTIRDELLTRSNPPPHHV